MFDYMVHARFWSKADVRSKSPNQCWPWHGATHGDDRGHFLFEGKIHTAPHVALVLSGKPRPSLEHGACHGCDNPRCVNPEHLWWGTQKANMLDCTLKRRTRGQKVEFCKRGHVLAGSNLNQSALERGRRECHACAELRKSQEVICPVCNKVFLAIPSRVSAGRGRTCSRQCSGAVRSERMRGVPRSRARSLS